MAVERTKREEEINRLFYLQSLYNQQYEALLSDMTTFSMAQAALERNIYLLDNKDKLKGSNVLVNAEGGTYVEANVKDVSKVITYIGAGYLVEKSVEQAREFLGKNLEAGRSQLKRLAGDRQKIENELMKIQYEIEALQQGRE